MRMRKTIALLAATSSMLLCAPGVSDRPGRTEPEVSSKTRKALAEPAPEVAPAAERERPVGIAGMTRTFVQGQPSYYMEAFHEFPSRRRRFMRTWNRRAAESEIIGRDRELYRATKVVLARVCFHESNWICDPAEERCGAQVGNTAELDCPAIYRVLRNNRRNGETLLGALRRHSPRVAEVRPPGRQRTRWVIGLEEHGRRPPFFPALDRDGAPLNWHRDYAPRWRALLDLADRLLRGEEREGCSGASLVTWGGRCEDRHGACDDRIALGRGLLPADCGPTSNRFWCALGGQCPVDSRPLSVALEEDVSRETGPVVSRETDG